MFVVWIAIWLEWFSDKWEKSSVMYFLGGRKNLKYHWQKIIYAGAIWIEGSAWEYNNFFFIGLNSLPYLF